MEVINTAGVRNIDTAELTGTAADCAQLSNLSAYLRGFTDEGRRAQVESLEAALASGRYRADSNATGGKIVEQSMRNSAGA